MVQVFQRDGLTSLKLHRRRNLAIIMEKQELTGTMLSGIFDEHGKKLEQLDSREIEGSINKRMFGQDSSRMMHRRKDMILAE